MRTIRNVEFKLDFESGNAAIVDNPIEATKEILRGTLERLEKGETSGSVRDVNGNGIGYWLIETEGDDDDDTEN